MWIIKSIYESDFGCEERMPGEPLLSCVELESDDGRIVRFEVPDEWLRMQELDEGDEWPEDIDDDSEDSSCKQADFMENYYDALEEYDMN